MAAPKMVDIRQLNPQQLSEVNQRLETEISVLNNCHAELVGVKKKFITSREAVSELEGCEGADVMVPLTGSLYVRGKFAEETQLIVDIGTQFYVEKTPKEAIEFFDRKIKYVEENMEKIMPQMMQKNQSRNLVESEIVQKMKAAKLAKPSK
ncbi:Oidioi.mRNA.OKI2018_I69.XSR.g15975.t1.cds [Oikopleura dioica]|uniref:Oidioi.mRNA.OKI2018_I69.XSR.g15975.t1.cds n=1 Tax=Oikopleura dioica TaxID=34765 RepID=A0ABN7SEK8_OIKDI|nr:Oidioi.mRNA.OKI2018_I69.XSR.g15975.t1.cds [Oikopleura dioica]